VSPFKRKLKYFAQVETSELTPDQLMSRMPKDSVPECSSPSFDALTTQTMDTVDGPTSGGGDISIFLTESHHKSVSGSDSPEPKITLFQRKSRPEITKKGSAENNTKLETIQSKNATRSSFREFKTSLDRETKRKLILNLTRRLCKPKYDYSSTNRINQNSIRSTHHQSNRSPSPGGYENALVEELHKIVDRCEEFTEDYRDVITSDLKQEMGKSSDMADDLMWRVGLMIKLMNEPGEKRTVEEKIKDIQKHEKENQENFLNAQHLKGIKDEYQNQTLFIRNLVSTNSIWKSQSRFFSRKSRDPTLEAHFRTAKMGTTRAISDEDMSDQFNTAVARKGSRSPHHHKGS